MTLRGPGTAGYDGSLPVPRLRAAMLTAAGRGCSAGSARRAGLPLDHRAQRRSPCASPRSGRRARRRARRCALVERDAVRRLAGTAGAAAGPAAPRPPAPRRRRDRDRLRRLRHLAREPAVRRRPRARAARRAPSAATCAGRRGLGPPAPATASSSAPAGSSTASAPATVRAVSSLSPRDDDGHGTQMASIAAGNAGVSVQVDDQRLGSYGGIAPAGAAGGLQGVLDRARPRRRRLLDRRPGHRDRRGRARPGRRPQPLRRRSGHASTPSSAPCSARPRPDVVVVAAAGNDGNRAFAAHAQPLGHHRRRHHRRRAAAATPALRRRHRRSTGAMASTRGVGPAPSSWAAATSPAPVARSGRRASARRAASTPRRVAGAHRRLRARRDRPRRQVRGRRLADGVGMVLVNRRGTTRRRLPRAAHRAPRRRRRPHPPRRPRPSRHADRPAGPGGGART